MEDDWYPLACRMTPCLEENPARAPVHPVAFRLALMAEGRSNQAISDRLSMARKTVEGHIANIFSNLELPPASDDHRRVLAVLAHLRGPG